MKTPFLMHEGAPSFEDEATGHRHVALVVHDDPEAADRLVDFVRELGHESIHVQTVADALAVARMGDVCYVLVDLSMASQGKEVSSPEAALYLIEVLRETFPLRNGRGKHLFPIVVMTADPEEEGEELAHLLCALYELGADGHVTKPVWSSPEAALAIRLVLARCGRLEHDRCLSRTRKAVRPGLALGAPRPRVRIPATHADGNEIVIAHRRGWLPDGAFVSLLRLVAARLEVDGNGWVPARCFGGTPARAKRKVSRLCDDLATLLAPGSEPIERNEYGHYRLDLEVVQVGDVDWRALESHADARVRNLARRVARYRREGRIQP